MSSSRRKQEYYDDVYFDTDDEEDQSKEVPSHDDLLYDPQMDDQDETWVINQIQKAAPPGKERKEAKTDAILTCPLCFTPLCYNCQRHEKYPNQYRAMFVTHCKVIKTERYRYKDKRKKQPLSSHQPSSSMVGADETNDQEGDEGYYIVKCSTCDTHVAMMDEDEVYHFFNTIAT
ncbi:E2F-associated phosphoprotein-domain-containing protein [Phascolomyces articulosus]|uniref:E2F-associated phosphoprotein-domain-containing protein n=1 Tax=Phascolomyces articulosus TaxID=60185 RepID=A0AAD5K0L9_9FUNG|nr:E2F-associated phosphoprotein-domain-containing protein [Phascolomyces articulosus]